MKKTLRRTYYLYHDGGTRFRIRVRGGRLEISSNRRPVPDEVLRLFADWVIECVDEARKEAGLPGITKGGA